ncbi:hypothetical protein R3W88_034221 [Solanum pinnatisectum]|uniref:Uncharacterized protein n=1 Tax=Solanum pinnatisectum TaxID=50273 RepID=A0AAV9K0J5_9SOLN|nr:hypothetical protein R3W88_034221 [Solanum pinnatisectum]
MLEKTFSTFLALSMLLHQQYREMRFKKYSKLISDLLIVEQHNDLQMKNHESQFTGSMPFPEVNTTNFHQSKRGKGRDLSHGHGRGQGRNFNHGDRLALNNKLTTSSVKRRMKSMKWCGRKNQTTNVINVVKKGIDHVPIVRDTWLSCIKLP